MAYLSSLAINLPTSFPGKFGLKVPVQATIVLVLLLGGCGLSPGSPRINITKNVYVVENTAPVFLGYSTKSQTTSDADIVQELKELLKIPAPKPGPGP